MVMVGDAVTDLVASKAAGVAAVAALWGAADEMALLAAGPDLVLRSPADLAIYWKQPTEIPAKPCSNGQR
jgi:AHBA synthesis associated protein